MSSLRIAQMLNKAGASTPMGYKLQNGEHFVSGFRRKERLLWQANSVNAILKNECYTGTLLQGKTCAPNYKAQKRRKNMETKWFRCENNHPAIISKEDFYMVHNAFVQDTRVAPVMTTLYPLSGFVECAYCHGSMTRKTIPANGKKYIYLICMEHKNKNGCANRANFSLAKLEPLLLHMINLQIYLDLTLCQKFSFCQKIFCTELSRVLLSILLSAIQIYSKDRIEILFLFQANWNIPEIPSSRGEDANG